MNYRLLNNDEYVLAGDKINNTSSLSLRVRPSEVGVRAESFGEPIYRHEPSAPTFEESANFDVVAKVSHEAVSEFEISQHSADEVIYATGQDKPQEWDGEVLNNKFGKTAAYEKYKMLFKGEFCLVYTSESHIECAGRVDECKFRPIKSARQVAIAEALEVFTGMISPSETQLGVLYDAGRLLPKKD